AFGGEANGTFGLAQSDAGATVKAQIKLSDIDLQQGLGELMGLRKLEGKGTLTVDLDSSGNSVYELAQGLNGTASLASQKGAVTGLNLEQLLKRFERSPLSRGDFRNGRTPYDQLTAEVRIIKGAAGIEEARLDAPALRLALVGSTSIPARDFDLKGVASLVSARALAPAFELPFVISRPCDKPPAV